MNKEISLIDIFITISRQIKTIIIFPSVLCLLTIFYVLFIADPIYTSNSKIMSSSASGGGASQAIGLAAQFGINLPTNQTEPVWNYPEIIKSRILAKSVIAQTFDTEKFGKGKKLIDMLNYLEDVKKHGPKTLESLAVQKFHKMIRVNENTQTSIVTLSIDTFEPSLAAQINKAIIEQLDSHQRDYNRSKSSETRIFIQKRIESTKQELSLAEEKLKIFRDRNRRIENSPALQLEQERLVREVTVLTGVFTTLKQQLETTKIKEVRESDYVIVIDPPEVPIIPSSPKKKLNVILAGIIGLGFGFIIAFTNDAYDKIDKKNKEKLLKVKSLIIANLKNLLFLK